MQPTATAGSARPTDGSRETPRPWPTAETSLRVSVKPSARDDTLYVVRPLKPGQRLPFGTREAMLVFSDEPTNAGPVTVNAE